MKLYVASSWRNQVQPEIVKALRDAGHEVYDFRNPEPGSNGFHWSEIDPEWKTWSPEKFKAALNHEIAVKGFGNDYSAMRWADASVMVMPCGRSAHLEAGYFVGAGKPLIILTTDGEPELMYKMADTICLSIDEVIRELKRLKYRALQLTPVSDQGEEPMGWICLGHKDQEEFCSAVRQAEIQDLGMDPEETDWISPDRVKHVYFTVVENADGIVWEPSDQNTGLPYTEIRYDF